MSDQIRAPFTPKQVEALNAFQRSGRHPYTCGCDRQDEAHTTYAQFHGCAAGQLLARADGWVCPVCDYRQDWAHDFAAAVDSQEVRRDA